MPLVLNDKSFKDRSLFWHFPIYLQGVSPRKDEARDSLFRTRPGSVVRKGKWKLHEYFEDNDIELYNLETDIREQNDVSNEYPEVVTTQNGSDIAYPKAEKQAGRGAVEYGCQQGCQ